MATWIWILVIVALVIVGVVAVMAAMQRRTATLRQRFGDEYDRTVQTHDDRRAAEAELIGRQKKRAQLDIRPLPEAERVRFAEDWHEVQERFVDEPSNAVVTADSLVGRAMRARGYPVDSFESQSDLVSVDHPKLVEDYRFAHSVYERTKTQQASTEDLREAMLRYRALFEELLRADGDGAARTPAGARAGETTAQEPANTTSQARGDAAEQAPANTTSQAPADAADQPPANTTSQAPADAADQPPANTTSQARADAADTPPKDGGQTTGSEFDTMRRGGR